ncbi:cell wall-active antibiotics response protein LiaF [Paenibacillus soyae]|uniref:Cell wall-active antibiotics response protein LiaF n=1 Tax=Paenibacillus soyae TaxID=2969249 RepID=A0A9X2MWY2_9BACL|nr:cell wall-active antibiotics response protein LiaF [Paenibacillus soyae]MCR2807940.1 cell wall-active antibiotics response protein LiaF [Paenibacillus soyae]
MNGNFASRLFTGLVVISLGVAFLLRQLGYLEFSIGEMFSTFWPCILIYFGLTSMLAGRSYGGSGWWGLIMIVIGTVFLGNNLGFTTWSVGDIIPFLIPVIIIFVGLRMIWSPKPRRQAPPSDEWKSYRPYQDEQKVPPAPPLHPDPTGASGEEEPKGYNPAGDAASWKSGESGDDRDGMNGSAGPYGKKRKHWHEHRKEHVEWWNHDSAVINRSGFIGDIHMGHDYWELKPMNISHFIGDTVLDLTKAQIPLGETKITISSFIGDVKVYVPNDFELGVKVVSSAFIGDVKVLGQKEGGLFTNVSSQSPRYSESDRRIKLIVSTFIGDTRVTKVG